MNKKWKIILIASILGNLAIFYVAIKALEYRAHINEYLEKYTYVVQEFSQRNRYAAENDRYVTKTPVENRIIFFGTQLTENWPVQKYFSEYEAINRGITGQRISGFLLRFRPDVIELKPYAVVIEAASFDFRSQNSVKEIEDYFACLCELAQAHNIMPLPSTIIPPCRDAEIPDLGDYSLPDSLALFNRWLKEYCHVNNFECLDFNTIVADDNEYLSPELSTGGIGLNEKGYAIISDMVAITLRRLR